MSVATWKCDDCGGEGYHFNLCPRLWKDPRDATITALRAEVARLEVKVAERTDRVLQLEGYKTDAINLRSQLSARDAEVRALRDKALRFDLDATGIESREREAVELVELRAKVKELLEYAQHHEDCDMWCSNVEGDRWLSDFYKCNCGLDLLLPGEPGPGGEGNG